MVCQLIGSSSARSCRFIFMLVARAESTPISAWRVSTSDTVIPLVASHGERLRVRHLGIFSDHFGAGRDLLGSFGGECRQAVEPEPMQVAMHFRHYDQPPGGQDHPTETLVMHAHHRARHQPRFLLQAEAYGGI